MILQVKDKKTGALLIDYAGEQKDFDGSAPVNDGEASGMIFFTITGNILLLLINEMKIADITAECDVLCDFSK